MASHLPVETIVISHKKAQITASPFKIPEANDKKLVEQNNYTNQSLIVIGKQLDKIETKVDKILPHEVKHKPHKEKPLVKFRTVPEILRALCET